MSVDEAIAPPDAACQRLIDALKAEFGDRVLGAEIHKTDAVVRVDAAVWADVARSVKKTHGYTFFSFLSGLDWLENAAQTTRYENVWGSVDEEGETDSPSDAADPLVDEPKPDGYTTGRAGGDSRFQVFARLGSPTTHRSLVLKADLAESEPHIATISGVFPGADWHERETWEMFGFWFDGHPGLTHIYLPGGFEGYPLRKDFPLLAREVKPWPGLTNVEPIAGETDEPEAASA